MVDAIAKNPNNRFFFDPPKSSQRGEYVDAENERSRIHFERVGFAAHIDFVCSLAPLQIANGRSQRENVMGMNFAELVALVALENAKVT